MRLPSILVMVIIERYTAYVDSVIPKLSAPVLVSYICSLWPLEAQGTAQGQLHRIL